MMFATIFEEAMPLIEEFAPLIASAFKSDAPIFGVELLKVLIETFAPEGKDFTLKHLEEKILNNPDAQKLLVEANEKALIHLKENLVLNTK